MCSVRRAVFVIGISSNVTIDFAENKANTTSVGSRVTAALRAFLMRGGVTATYSFNIHKLFYFISEKKKQWKKSNETCIFEL